MNMEEKIKELEAENKRLRDEAKRLKEDNKHLLIDLSQYTVLRTEWCNGRPVGTLWIQSH